MCSVVWVWSPTASRPRLSGLFHVAGRCARIAVRGGRNARLVAAGTTAGRRPLGPAPTDTSGRGILELFAHASELCRVLRAEPTALLGRLLTVASATTTHRRCTIAAGRQRTALVGYLRALLRRLLRGFEDCLARCRALPGRFALVRSLAWA